MSGSRWGPRPAGSSIRVAALTLYRLLPVPRWPWSRGMSTCTCQSHGAQGLLVGGRDCGSFDYVPKHSHSLLKLPRRSQHHCFLWVNITHSLHSHPGRTGCEGEGCPLQCTLLTILELSRGTWASPSRRKRHCWDFEPGKPSHLLPPSSLQH